MRRTRTLLLFSLVFSTELTADTVSVDGERFSDVYVAETSGYYNVLFPDTGEVRSFSSKRRDIKVEISTDHTLRAALKAEWESKRDSLQNGADAIGDQERPPKVATIAAEYFHHEYLRDLAEFESALRLWKLATPKQRASIMSRESRVGSARVAEKVEQAGQLAESREMLGEEIGEWEELLHDSKRSEEKGIQRAYSDFSLVLRKNMLEDSQQRRILEASKGRDVTHLDQEVEHNQNEYEVRRRRAEGRAKEVSAMERARQRALNSEIKKLDSVDKRLQSDLTVAQLTAEDRAYRAFSKVDLLQRMESAIQNGYNYQIPYLELAGITSERAAKELKVSVDQPFWRVCWSVDPTIAGTRQFRIAIHDIDSGRLVTGATDSVPFYKRYLVLKGPGEFRVSVTNVLEGASYRVWVETPDLALDTEN